MLHATGALQYVIVNDVLWQGKPDQFYLKEPLVGSPDIKCMAAIIIQLTPLLVFDSQTFFDRVLHTNNTNQGNLLVRLLVEIPCLNYLPLEHQQRNYKS
jgi:hypothetical protein